MDAVESSATEVQEEAGKILRRDDDDDDAVGEAPKAMGVDDDELYELETVAKKAKKAAGTTSQVRIHIHTRVVLQICSCTKKTLVVQCCSNDHSDTLLKITSLDMNIGAKATFCGSE